MPSSRGVTRVIDHLGRTVIPAEIRRALGIRNGDMLDFRSEGGAVVIRPVEPSCAVCDGRTQLLEVGQRHLCEGCATEAARLV